MSVGTKIGTAHSRLGTATSAATRAHSAMSMSSSETFPSLPKAKPPKAGFKSKVTVDTSSFLYDRSAPRDLSGLEWTTRKGCTRKAATNAAFGIKSVLRCLCMCTLYMYVCLYVTSQISSVHIQFYTAQPNKSFVFSVWLPDFRKYAMVIVGYKYKENHMLKNLILRTKLCVLGLSLNPVGFFISARPKWLGGNVLTSWIPALKGHSGGAGPRVSSHDS